MALKAACRSCNNRGLTEILSLGTTPLANALLATEQLQEREPMFPLDLAFCPSCTLVQITETIPPEQLFSAYPYFSSYSDTMLRHAEALVGEIISSRRLNEESLVVEIASNDGYLLQYYKRAGIRVLGVEPARNVAEVAVRERGIPTVVDFFGEGLAQRLAPNGMRADVIHAHNVLAHVADLNGFVRGIRPLLKEGGVSVIEVPYVKELIDRCEFDTVYHEHLCYFSLTSLDRLFRRHGLLIENVRRIPIHGGSLRITVGVDSDGRNQAHGIDSVANLLSEEKDWGVGSFEFYASFGARVERLRETLRSLLVRLRREGNRIAAYGAAAKGSTLLNFLGMGREILDFVADRSPHKQGRYMPGTHLPICAPERLLEEMPQYVLLLSWNLVDEILDQQREYRLRGGRFIIPVPEVRII